MTDLFARVANQELHRVRISEYRVSQVSMMGEMRRHAATDSSSIDSSRGVCV